MTYAMNIPEERCRNVLLGLRYTYMPLSKTRAMQIQHAKEKQR